MADAAGKSSYVAFGQQSVFGTAQSSLTTAANNPTGKVFSPPQVMNLRDGVNASMQPVAQAWKGVAFNRFNLDFYLLSDAAWKALFLAAFGKRADSGAGPFTRIYTVFDPLVDGGTDGTPAGTVYNHGLTIRHTLHDGNNEVKTYVSQDCNVDQFQILYEANKPMFFKLTGTGQPMVASTIPSFVAVSGALMTWAHGAKSANSGFYISGTNPPALNGTDSMKLKKLTFTLNNNPLYDSFMFTVAGQELAMPVRNDYATSTMEIEGRFNGGMSEIDAVDIVADFLAQTARNLRATLYIDASNSLEILASGSSAPGLVDEPSIEPTGNGPVGFKARYLIGPSNVSTDFKMVAVTPT